MKKAREEGRVCPTCKFPVSKSTWTWMQKNSPDKCYDCHMGDVGISGVGCRGSVMEDNISVQDIENRINR